MAEVLLLSNRSEGNLSAAASAEVTEILESVLRGTRDKSSRIKARLLQARQAMDESMRDEFRLRLRSIQQPPNSDGLNALTLLTICDHLFHQEATEAAGVLNVFTPQTALDAQTSLWLSLECELGRLELADSLEDSKLAAEVDAEFSQLSARNGSMLLGAFKEAAQRTANRFALVKQVGVEIADLVEGVDRFRLNGDNGAALRTTERAINKLAPDDHRPRGALLLRAGEILVEKKKWQRAVSTLSRASTEFDLASREDEHAASDLLRIFALGQTMKSDRAVQAAYVGALKDHVRKFESTPSVNTAIDWLLKAIGTSNPQLTLQLKLQLAESETEPFERIVLITEAGDFLLKYQGGMPEEHEQRFSSLAEMVIREANDAQASDPALLKIRLQLQELTLSQRSDGEALRESLQTVATLRLEIQQQLPLDEKLVLRCCLLEGASFCTNHSV